MTDPDDERGAAKPPPRDRGRRAARAAAGVLIGLLVLIGGVLLLIDSAPGHRFLAARIAALRPANGLRYRVGRIDGSLWSNAVLVDVAVADHRGIFFAAPRAELGWTPTAWLANRLELRRLVIASATLARLPQTRAGHGGPILPGFDIRIDRLRIDRLILGRAIGGSDPTGAARTAQIGARADVHAGRALVELAAAVGGTDTLRLRLDAEPDRDRFDLAARLHGTRGGALAGSAGLALPIDAQIAGRGRWSDWHGTATADVGNTRIVDLTMAIRAGAVRLGGVVAPASLLSGKGMRLTEPQVRVAAVATLSARHLEGELKLRSGSLAVGAAGGVDLGENIWHDLRIEAHLLRPEALFPNMTGSGIALHAIVDGPFASARFDYRLTADRFAFDATGFENVRATGSGHWSASPVMVPIALSAARVTGVGDVAGGILRDLKLTGLLRVTNRLVTGDDLRLASDKLSGRINLLLDLANGDYRIGVNGTLGRYLIPGLGIVDVATELHVVPGSGGRGTRVIGTGTAQMIRLDNGFFRSLMAGLPRIETGLERTPDGVLHLTGLTLVSPSLRLAGIGLRRRDGSFQFTGSGHQASYGPLTIGLDGKIDHPTLDLVFASPNATLGLSGVVAHLDPTPQGFGFTARGGSRLGPFAGAGAILLPPGAAGAIVIAALDVIGTRASGTLGFVPGGFDGQLRAAGGGIGGDLAFRAPGGVQSIEAHLALAGAGYQGISVRRGRLDLTTTLDGGGGVVDATMTGTGLRRGGFTIGRFAANARLRGGTGEVQASIAGSRGRAFDIQTLTRISAAGYAFSAEGTLDRRPLRLLEPALIARDDAGQGGGWRLATTRLTFAGGTATVAGRFGPTTQVDATMAAMPLSILDIGYPGLALGGSASGHLVFAQAGRAPPTGRIDATIRGLTRSGLVLSSQPVDVGVAALLEPGRAAGRAVIATEGKTVGRAQAVLTLTGATGAVAPLTERLAHAPLFAQLRYAGPANTLWRLTGVELFDLTGPIAIGADVGGRVDAPTIRGLVRANGARIESGTTGTVLTGVEAQGRFGGSRLVIDRFAADAGKGGRVDGTGSFDFAAAHGLGIELTLDAHHAVMINRDDLGATVSGALTFRSDGQGGVIAGDVRLDRSRYRLGEASAATAVPQLALREINLPGGGEEDEVPRAPWRLAITAHAANQLSVEGLGLRSEWSAELKLAGAPDNPAISGRADLIRGDYQFAGREFQLDRGKILFSGEVPANPALDIAANADSSGLSATIRVTGPATKPEIGFTSVPALPQDELLSRLLFGTSITNLSAPEALQLAAAVAALHDSKGGLNPINAVRRVAGLDRLRILPADPQTGAHTSVAAGKYITRRLFAEIVTDGQGYSATQVEFQVTRWLSLLSSISTIGRQSGNVRVSKDY